MNSIKTRLSRAGLALIPLLAISLASCASYAHLVRDAQDSFSRGAEIQNARKFGQSESALEMGDAERHYAVAYGLCQRAIDESKGDLESSDLYGAALTIQALSAWRLGDTTEAVELAGDVVALSNEKDASKVWPRDRAVCMALDPLIKIDNLAAITADFSSSAVADDVTTRVLDRAAGIRDSLRVAAGNLPPGHPAQVYFVEAEGELAFVAWNAAGKVPPPISNAMAKTINDLTDELMKQFDALEQQITVEEAKASLARLRGHYKTILPKLVGN